MSNQDKIVEIRKEKAKKWIKDPYNFSLVGILILSIFVRFYFLIIAKDQAHWWDTLAYGSLAKESILGLWTNNHFIISEGIIRPPLLPLVWSFLLRLNISDFGTLLLLEIIPSVLSVFLIYLIGKELYDKRVGLISAFIASVSWIHLFYSVRIMTDVPSLFLALASIYFFVKTYDKIKLKYFSFSILFLSLAILMRYSYGLIGIVYIIFLGIIHKQKIFRKKNFWFGGLIGVIPLVLFFFNNFLSKGEIFPAVKTYTTSATEKATAFYVMGFIPYIMKSYLTPILIIGLLLVLFEILIGFDSIFKIKKLKSHLFVLLLAAVSLFFFVFVIKAAEDRYLFMIFPSLFFFTAIGLIFLYSFPRKYSKSLAVIFVLGVLLFSAYSQLSFGNDLIENKKTSFLPMKEAFVWINENTPQDAVIIGDWADPYAIYYAERRLGSWPSNVGEKGALDNFSLENIDYLTLTRVHKPTQTVVEFANKKVKEGKLTPLKIFFFDDAQTQPAVIIYKVNNNT